MLLESIFSEEIEDKHGNKLNSTKAILFAEIKMSLHELSNIQTSGTSMIAGLTPTTYNGRML